MNLAATSPLWLYALLIAALVAAAIEDARRFRISNVTCIAVAVGAVVAAVVVGPTWALWQNVVIFIVLLALGTLAFGAKWLGGGDVKLIAALGLWIDFWSAPLLLAAIFIGGGVVAILYILARPFRAKDSASRRALRIPYGLAIAVGALVAFQVQRAAVERQSNSLPALPTTAQTTHA